MTTQKAPLIGINAGVRKIENSQSLFLTVNTRYADAVKAAGGIPVILPAIEDDAILDAHLQLCDGFVFTGGPDMDPALYGQEKHEKVVLMESRRQNYDMALIEKVIASRKPFLGICLGCQEVNVVLGGTLIQDIPSAIETELVHSSDGYTRQEVDVHPGTLVAKLTGGGRINANTAHHQSVDQPGKGLKVSAVSPTDGVIESLELEDYPFGVAIQWHPEMISEEAPHRGIFVGLVEAARKA